MCGQYTADSLRADASSSPSKPVKCFLGQIFVCGLFAVLALCRLEAVTAGVGQKAAGMRALLALALFGACIGTFAAAGRLIMAPRAAWDPLQNQLQNQLPLSLVLIPARFMQPATTR